MRFPSTATSARVHAPLALFSLLVATGCDAPADPVRDASTIDVPTDVPTPLDVPLVLDAPVAPDVPSVDAPAAPPAACLAAPVLALDTDVDATTPADGAAPPCLGVQSVPGGPVRYHRVTVPARASVELVAVPRASAASALLHVFSGCDLATCVAGSNSMGSIYRTARVTLANPTDAPVERVAAVTYEVVPGADTRALDYTLSARVSP